MYYGNIEASIKNTKSTCCATYVASVLYLAGYFTEEEINKVEYNNCGGIVDLLQGCCEKIESTGELEAGDIVLFSYKTTTYTYDHVEIYAGNGTWLGAGSTSAIQNKAPSSSNNSFLMNNFKEAYRISR